MSKPSKLGKEVFNTMHKLEQAGISQVQAEATVRAVDSQVSNGVQLIFDELDEVKADLGLTKRIISSQILLLVLVLPASLLV